MLHAFSKAGILKEDIEFDRAISQYLNNGGTIERAYDRVHLAAAKLRGSGPSAAADHGLRSFAASAQSSLPQDGHGTFAASGRPNNAIQGQPQAGNGGLLSNATHGQRCPAPIARPQSDSDRAARAAVKKSLSVFDRELTRTGQMWGNVSYMELGEMIYDADIAAAIMDHLENVISKSDRMKKLRDLMSTREFTQILAKVRKNAA